MLIKLALLLRPYQKQLVVALVASLGATAANLLQPWPLKVVFDSVFQSKPLPTPVAATVGALFGPGPTGALSFALEAILVVACVGAVSVFVAGWLMTRVANSVLYELRSNLYWHIQRLSLAYHDQRRVGELVGTLTTDTQAIQDLVAQGLVGILVSGLTLIGMVVVMFALHWRFALLALSIAPLLFALTYRFTRRIKRATRDIRKREGEIAATAHEVLSAIRIVQANTREDYEQSRFEWQNQQRVSAGVQARTLQSALPPLVDVMVAIGTAVVLGYGAHEVLAGSLAPGELLVYLAYLTMLYKPMRDLSKVSEVMFRASVGLERIFAVLEVERSVRDLPGAREAKRLRGHIEVQHVWFAYGDRRPALADICFDVQPGQVVALVGATGAGKTTIASLLPRFNDPTRGSMRIDGRDVREYTLASLRGQIALVLQETVLFYGTVHDNIAYGRPEASVEEVVAAAMAAHAHEFIERLPDGYDTLIGERGATLSGGERQLLALARAMVRDAPIVVLDEPTTGLDASAEALVLDGMGRLMRGRTVLVIAHRLSTISRADLILVVEHGRIVERGTHDSLLAAGGRYRELFELQSRGQVAVPVGGAR